MSDIKEKELFSNPKNKAVKNQLFPSIRGLAGIVRPETMSFDRVQSGKLP
jgi:hypothetical protein